MCAARGVECFGRVNEQSYLNEFQKTETVLISSFLRCFCVSLALILPLKQLIILEVAGLLDPAPSSLLWKTCLSLMVVGLHLVLPFLLAYACLGEIGLGR